MRKPLAFLMSLLVLGAAVWLPTSALGQVFPGSPVGGGGSGSGGCATTGCTYTGAITMPVGAAGTPAITFTGATTTGIYKRSGAVISLSVSGTGVTEQSASGLNTTIGFGWYSGAIGTSIDATLRRHAAGVVRLGDDTASSIRGFMGGGTDVASATAMPLPTGRVFHVTGTTAITSITSTNFEAGTVITLIFDDVLTFTDGNNLVLAGNFVTTTSDTITLAYDGTNWHETGRSVN